MTSQQPKEIKVSGNGEIQHHPYNPKMNSGAWEPVIWYTQKGDGMSGICDTCDTAPCFWRSDLVVNCSHYMPKSETNYERLFGTPERAARTIADISERVNLDGIGGDCDALLEWLGGDAE